MIETIKDIYEIEKGNHFTNRPVNDKKQKGFIANYTIVGYQKDTRYYEVEFYEFEPVFDFILFILFFRS